MHYCGLVWLQAQSLKQPSLSWRDFAILDKDGLLAPDITFSIWPLGSHIDESDVVNIFIEAAALDFNSIDTLQPANGRWTAADSI